MTPIDSHFPAWFQNVLGIRPHNGGHGKYGFRLLGWYPPRGEGGGSDTRDPVVIGQSMCVSERTYMHGGVM